MVFSLPSASFLFLCMCLLRSISTSPYTLATSSRRTSGTWLGALGPVQRTHMNIKNKWEKEWGTWEGAGGQVPHKTENYAQCDWVQRAHTRTHTQAEAGDRRWGVYKVFLQCWANDGSFSACGRMYLCLSNDHVVQNDHECHMHILTTCSNQNPNTWKAVSQHAIYIMYSLFTSLPIVLYS